MELAHVSKPLDSRPQMRPALINVWGEDGLEDLERAWEDYFTECEAKNQRPSVAGLAITAKVNWGTFRNYRWKKDWLPPAWECAIKRAWDRVVRGVEDLLINRPSGQVGCIFWLKNNAGYRDTVEHDIGPNLQDGMRMLVAGVLASQKFLDQPTVIDAEVKDVGHDDDES